MTDDLRRQRQIEFFYSQRQSATRLDAVPDDLRPYTKSEAYDILSGVHAVMRSAGATQSGYKIGCTTPETQKTQNTDEPTWAGLFAENKYPTIAEALATLTPPYAVECEIAFRLGREVDPSAGPLTPDNLIGAIDDCMIGCEIVQNRYGKPLERGLPTLIADDFFQAGYVLGEPLSSWRELDLTRLQAECRVGDRIVEKGQSDIVMGSALNALCWLANERAGCGLALEAGDIILSGSITKPYWFEARPARVELFIEGFGVLR